MQHSQKTNRGQYVEAIDEALVPDACICLGFRSDLCLKQNREHLTVVSGPFRFTPSLHNLGVHNLLWKCEVYKSAERTPVHQPVENPFILISTVVNRIVTVLVWSTPGVVKLHNL